MDGVCPWDLNQLCTGRPVVKDTCIIYGQGFQKGIVDLASLGFGCSVCGLGRAPALLKNGLWGKKMAFRNPIPHYLFVVFGALAGYRGQKPKIPSFNAAG